MRLAEDLIDQARAATGLDDFGSDSFREGLERATRALEDEAKLSIAGRAALHGMMVGYLSTRLRIEDWYRRHPEMDDEPILSPVVGLGLPRTGSTALSNLLGEDPGIRYLRRWEALEPVPPPSTVPAPDPRLLRQIEVQRQRTEFDQALVPSFPDGPHEDHDLMGLDFRSHYFECFAQVPSYADWLLETDLTPTYLYLRRALKFLQWGQPARPWRLKNPNHLCHLADFHRAFPEARFVMTHRDPTEVLVSVSDVFANVGARFSETVDRQYIGELATKVWSVGMRRALEFRDAGNDHLFYDIDFRAMQRDPVGEVRGLYAWLGEPVTPQFEANMRRWWQENSVERLRIQHSDPAEYGLDLDRIRPLFADYTARAARWTAHGTPAVSTVPSEVAPDAAAPSSAAPHAAVQNTAPKSATANAANAVN